MAKAPKINITSGDLPGAPWSRNHATYIAGQAAIDEADKLAREAELKWGVDRLRLLVPVELREKFDRQRYKLNAAIHGADLETVKVEAARMATAWRTLDRVATEAGAKPIDADVWEVALDDGSVAAIVRSEVEARFVVANDRSMRVYTLAEIARLLSGFPTLAKVKDAFPGAGVVAAREVRDPLDAIDHATSLNDEIPF